MKTLDLAKKHFKKRKMNEMILANLDIDGRREKVSAYIIKGLAYDIILGNPG